MIKGKVTIDLHNHKTGLKDRIEQENMVTDAIPDLAEAFADFGHKISEFSSIAPLCNSGLGGLILWDNTLTENASNYHFPNNAKPLAFVARGSDTSTANRGSLNGLETGWIDDDTYMNVWDFNTSQANGIIKSLSLVHKDIGENPSDVAYVIEDMGDEYATNAYIDFETMDFYGIMPSYSDNKTYWVKTKKYYSDLPIGASFGSYEYANEKVVELGGYNSSANRISYWYYNGEVYFKMQGSTNLCKINPQTGALTVLKSLSIYDYIAVVNGYLYTASYRGAGSGKEYSEVRKYSLSNLSTYTTINTGLSNSYGGRLTYIGNGVIAHFTTNETIYIYPDDSIYKPGTYIPMGYEKYTEGMMNQDEIISIKSPYYYLCAYKNYLGTICNLAQPIEKNSTTSMKVKYTITNA